MPFISSLKESFAAAPIQDREAIVQKLATANTEDANYYQGLLILQKIYNEVMKQEEPAKPRESTSIERELSDEMQAHLKKFSTSSDRLTELDTRFHLLIYPFDTLKSIEFIKKNLYLDLLPQKQEQQQQKENNDHPTTTTASVLDNNLINGFNVLKKSFDEYQTNGSLDVAFLAFPEMKSSILEKNLLNEDEEVAFLKQAFDYPTERLFGNDILDRLTRLWKLQASYEDPKTSTWRLEDLPFCNFTLSQLDQLITNIPNIVLLHENFIRTYLEKLIPAQYYEAYTNGVSIYLWDDDEDILQGYLARLEEFAQKLPAIYFHFKSAVKFYQLRVDIARQNLNEINLIQYLASTSDKSTVSSPIPSRVANVFGFSNSNISPTIENATAKTSINIPLLGSCKISEQYKILVVQEYLTGLITQGNLTKNPEALGAYMDYHNVLKPLFAKLMLTLSPDIQESWVTALGSERYESLVVESSINFTPSTLNVSVKRKPNDPIRLSVRTKNIQRLSIRVFQINMENYCRLHLDSDENTIADENNKVDLDGLCPTWEKDIDFSSEPAIRVKTNDFVFGNDSLAPNVFEGRGLWVIEFVGGQNQCRAIIQKGYLKHVIQETTAGHIVRVLDESGKTLNNSKIWCGNQYYQADKNNNILIPYLPSDSEAKMTKMLLMSNLDEFCEPASFYQLAEKYKLEADFYVNPEMVSFNKKVTVIVNPRLSMNGIPVPLSLLEKMTLVAKCTNVDDVANSTTCQNVSQYPNSIYFEFMVPDRLSSLEFTLQAKIKTLKDTLETIDVKHTIKYGTVSDNIGVPSSVHLRKAINDKYYIHVFGKNGEPKTDYEVRLKLQHTYIKYHQVEVTLKTNSEGSIELGTLDNIQWVEYSNSYGTYKQWLINNDKQSLLPPAICVSANTSFKVACPTPSLSDSLFSLYKIGVREMLVEDVSDKISKNDNYIAISGLPEGEYLFYVASTSQGTTQIKCTVIEGQVDTVEAPEAANDSKDRFWSDWVIGNDRYAKQNGIVLHRPLDISEVSITAVSEESENVAIQLQNWSSKTFAVVTTSTFVPTSAESLNRLMLNRSLTKPLAKDNRVVESKSLFLDDKQLSEEYQYVLNRARAEKWVGSNLTKPTLLMYPKKNATTTSRSRHLRNDKYRTKSTARKSTSGAYGAECANKFFYEIYPSMKLTESSLAFLDHDSPIFVLPVSAEGTVSIDRQTLGYGGDLLQVVAFSGEQVVSKNIVLPPALSRHDAPLFRCNDLRQKSSSNKALIRSRVVKNLLPNEKVSIGSSEYETIDSFEKMLDTIKTISNVGDDVAREFDYLKTWSGLDVEKKLKLHEEKVCHEFNFWLKRKDIVFFNEFVRPAIKSKIQKSFMDLYLIDANLSEFSNNIYKYGQLRTAEKSLLATTRPKEFLQTVLRSFKESFDDKKVDDRSDAIFDSILAGSALAVPTTNAISTDDIQVRSGVPPPPPPVAAPMSLISAHAAPNRATLFGFAAPQAHGFAAVNRNTAFAQLHSYEESDGEVDNYDDEWAETETDLREKAREHQKKIVYEFTKSTSEWVESGYFNSQNDIPIKQFWIDYLEYHLNKSDDQQQDVFLSESFMYSLNNLTEVFYVLSLVDLPFASETSWSMEATVTNVPYVEPETNEIFMTICASATQPLMVFYRTLTESTEPFSVLTGNSDNNLMLGQELFIFDEDTPIDSDECIKINPLTNHFDPLVKYGTHIIISNVSAKTLTCQVTVQVPTGSVPCKDTPYCRSKTISIEPYSTWHKVTGTFYFPTAGKYTVVPVTVSSLSGDKLLGKIEAIDINVIGESSSDTDATIADADATTSLSLASWPTLANNGSSANVISFLDSYKKLDRLDFSLIGWRMKDKAFARQVFDVLSEHRCFYSQELWKYGVYHQFKDILRDLLYYNSNNLLVKAGQVFESPLINKKREDYTQVFDYYPLLNARAHPLKSTSHEILNTQFYQQYDQFLNYLSQQTSEPSSTDLVILTLYLVLQDRIGEAQSTFTRIQPGRDNLDCQVQIDYLEAYLKTRVPVVDQMEQQLQDLESVKEIASKYKDFGVLKWRKLFAELYDFVCEVEQGDSVITEDSSRDSTRKIHSEPILEFEINQQHQELVVQFANLKSIDVKYYEMNIEVMFSTNPFMNDGSASMVNNENFTWIKPSYSLRVDLPEKQKIIDATTKDDYNMIGAGQINSVQTLNIPFTGGNKNIFVEISSVGIPNAIKRRQAYFSHRLYTHIAESFGIVRVMSGKTKRPLAGAYVKVYARIKQGQKVQFWKDGYTGLNGVFDYIGVTEGNALMGGSQTDLKTLMDAKIDKLSILIISADEGAVVKEAYPPSTA